METIINDFFADKSAETINEALDDVMQEALNHNQLSMGNAFFFLREVKAFLLELDKAQQESVQA
jgi:uncharacterized protein YggL (DUF469 family)